MSESRLQLKVGIVEFSGEGNSEWLSEQLDKVLLKIPEYIQSRPEYQGELGEEKFKKEGVEAGSHNLSAVSVAAKMKVKSGQDLVLAAVAYLRFVQGKSTFSREEILTTMKSATGYYQKNYSGNLTKMLTALIKNESIMENANHSYSLHANKESELNGTIFK